MKKITVSFRQRRISLWLIIVSVMMIFGVMGSAMAQQDARQQIKEVQQNVQEKVNGLKQNIREEVKQDREVMKKEFEAKRTEAKNLMESKKEEFKNKVEAKKEEVKSQIEAKRTELKTRLAKIKDERKKQVVERVFNQVNELNMRRLDHFSAVLEKLEKVLDRISSRAAKAEANDRDISVVKTAITEATNSIALSRTAIQNQAGKVYAPVISTESALKTDVGKIRQALHGDLAGVQETVKTSKESVRKAATTLAQIPKVDELEVEATTATTTQPVQ